MITSFFKRSYSSNGNTFMPIIRSFYANPFLYFLGVPKSFLKCWGFLLRTNNKTNFNDVCSVCTPTPKIEILMISAAVHWKYIPNTEGPPFWHHVFMPTPIKNFSGWLKHFFFCKQNKKVYNFLKNTPTCAKMNCNLETSKVEKKMSFTNAFFVFQK